MRRGINLLMSLLLIMFLSGCVENGDIVPGPEPKYIDKEEKIYTDDEDLNTEDELDTDDEQVNTEDEDLKSEDELNADDNEIKTLLTDEFENVEDIGVLYPFPTGGYGEVRYNIAKDKDKIQEIYSSMKGTKAQYYKVDPSEEGPQSGPAFIINIYYMSGEVDEIISGESREYIYRNTSTKNPSFVGGSNYELKDIIGDGQELYSTEYEKLGKNIKDMLVAFRNNIKNENKKAVANLVTANITEADYQNIKEGELYIYIPETIIYFQNGDVSIKATNSKSSKTETTYEYMTFTFSKEQDMKIDKIECITKTFTNSLDTNIIEQIPNTYKYSY